MKKIIISLMFGTLALGLSAQDSGLGAGIMVGEPTGISVKSWISSNDALDAGVAWSLSHGWLHVHADYLRHSFGLIPVEVGQVPLYYGAGAVIGLGREINLGIRVPLGVAYLFEDVPIDIFMEIAPTLVLIPDTDFEIQGGIGVRYWF
jgi:hypothetical protein